LGNSKEAPPSDITVLHKLGKMREDTDRFRHQNDKKVKETLEINPKTLAVTKKGKATSVAFSTKPT
jgi:hypothetical protein